ncbi:hypothetical protein PUN28_001947 [Cardiocondyla obscurior]|uniref:Uncharacterized protein n=1 Tax=Cardiocondyla obscurior TaxID=286306 RepID=A0AAW2GS27_9HYME
MDVNAQLRQLKTLQRYFMASSFPAYLVNQSPSAKPGTAAGRRKEVGGLSRLAGDRRTDAPCLIHIQRKLNMRGSSGDRIRTGTWQKNRSKWRLKVEIARQCVTSDLIIHLSFSTR